MNKKNPDTLPLAIAKEIAPEQLLKRLHSVEWRMATIITNFSGSMPFVYFHVVFFTLFFIFRPFEVDVFNIFLSLEAVFLATFIMISQNRQALLETVRELEEEQEEQEAEEEVEDIQKDLDDIKNAMSFIQQKISSLEKHNPTTNGNGNGKPHKEEETKT